MRRIAFIVLITLLIAAAWLWQRQAQGRGGTDAQASLLPLPADEDVAGFARATEAGVMRFPRDLGPHPDYQTEWWYYTGNLQAEDGRRFGYQLTFFRRALTPGGAQTGAGAEDESAWRSNQVYLAHFAISDIDGGAFYADERFSRGAMGLAGAQAAPYRVWLEDWSAQQTAAGDVRLTATGEEVALDLTLRQTLPPILHGEQGLSPKGPEAGNASYYYSLVRQETSGAVTVRGETAAVSGWSWKDHEYSTSALSPGAIGWDWFSLQLDNGGALMFFQIRRDDGSLQAESSGTLLLPDGSLQHVTLEMWALDVTDTWTSPHSGATYPAGWRLEIAELDLTLEGAPLLADQELNVSTVYWEGAVRFEGQWQGQAVMAHGYVEMTGYAGTMEGRI